MNSDRIKDIIDTAITCVTAAGFTIDNSTGNRKRFKRDDIEVTIGPQTVNFYRVQLRPITGKPIIISIGSASTRNLEKITAIIVKTSAQSKSMTGGEFQRDIPDLVDMQR